MESGDVIIETVGRAESSQSGLFSLDLMLIVVGSLVMLVLPIAFTGSFALAVIKKSKGWGIATGIFGVVSLVATAALLILARDVSFTPSGPMAVQEWNIHELPGGMQIEVLDSWAESSQEDGSVLFSSPGQEFTFAVIVESRERFAVGFPLAAYAEFYAEQIDDQLGKDFRRDRLRQVTLGGKTGYRIKIQHLADPPSESVLAGFLEHEALFYRMVGKCPLSNLEQIEEILESIRLLEGNGG